MFKPDFSVKTYAEGKINSGMIDVNKLPEFPGFTVYDAETWEPNYDAIYATDVNGEDQLYRNYIAMECGNEVPRAGSYIIQMGTGEYYKW